MFRLSFLTKALALGAVFAVPAISQAAFTVTVSDTNGNSHTFTDPSNSSISDSTIFTYAGGGKIEIKVNATSNSPGDLGQGQVTNQTVEVKQKAGAAIAAVDLTIVAASTGFTLGSGNVLVGTSLAASGLLGSATGVTNIDGSPVAGSNVASAGGSGSTSDSKNNVPANVVDPFTFGNSMAIHLNSSAATTGVDRTLAQVQINSEAMAVAPAPSGLILALTGLPLLALGCYFRRSTRNSVCAVA